MPERKFFKIENYGRADSLQNANHCRPTVFVYIEVAFKCMGGCYGVAIILLYSENSYKRKRSALRTPFSYAHKIIKKEGNSCLIKQQFNLAGFQAISYKLLPYASILTLTVIKVKTVMLFFVIDSNNIV